MSAPAVFLDRDGVLIEDVDRVTSEDQIQVIEGAPEALRTLADAGYRLVVVTNQPIVARGLATEEQVARINEAVADRLSERGGARIEGAYYCPHHPHGYVAEYRAVCDCRKPRPGLILRAARELDIDTSRSWMVGDRVTDIVAGRSAGCRTALVRSGRHADAPIVTADPLPDDVEPNAACADLRAVAELLTR